MKADYAQRGLSACAQLKNGLIFSTELAIFIGMATVCMVGFVDDLLYNEYIFKYILNKLNLLEPSKKNR